jgi:hypothetical protein
MAKKKPQIPLNDVMLAIDRKNRTWYDNLSDEQVKAFSAWMMMRYASSVQGGNAASYLFMVNECVNKNFMDLSKHPELQWLLFTLCGSGKKEYHPYIKPPGGKKKKNKVAEWLSSQYPHMKPDEIQMLCEINDLADIKAQAMSAGLTDKEIKEIFGK